MFNAHSISVMLGCRRVDAYAPVIRNLSRVVRRDSGDGLSFASRWSDMAWADLSSAERIALLTFRHETDHFAIFTSSPLFLLSWRINELLLELTAVFTRTLDLCGLARIPPGQTLTEWFRIAGLAVIQEMSGRGELPPLTGELATFDSVVSALQTLAAEIEVLDQFRKLLFDLPRPDITIGDFLPIADKAYALLSRRWNRPWTARWATRSPPNLPLYPDPAISACLTTPELLEGLARLRERELMEAASATPEQILEWERQHVTGFYKPGYDLLLSKLGDVQSAYLAGRLALASPIDLECLGAHGPEIFIEDVLPIYRLARLTLAWVHMNKTWTADLAAVVDALGLADTLLQAAALPDAAKTLAPIVQGAIEPMARFRDVVDTEPSSSCSSGGIYDHRRYALGMIEKFQTGHRAFLHSIYPPGRLAHIFLQADQNGDDLAGITGFRQAFEDQLGFFPPEPDMTVFQDRISFNGRREGRRAFSFGDNMLHLLFTEACRSLIKPTRRMRRPDDLIAMFVARLHAAECSDEIDGPPVLQALRSEEALELAAEWERLRAIWPSADVGLERFWSYLRAELGAVAANTLKERSYSQPMFA